MLVTEQNLISEQPLGLHTYPPSSFLPISHSDIGISSAEDSTRERPTHHGTQQKKGLWNDADETHRALKSRHLTMIGMYPSYTSRGTVKTFFRPAIGGTIGTGIFLTAGIVRWSISLSYCCMQLTFIASRLYQQAVLQVHFSPILFLAYLLMPWWLLCMLNFLWLNSVLTTPFDLILSGEMSSMYPVSGAFSTFGTRFVSPALGFTLGKFKLQLVIIWINMKQLGW